MKRPGIVSFDMLMGQNDDSIKKWLLLYDEIWVPGFNAQLEAFGTQDFEFEEDKENFAKIRWLSTKKEIIESPISLGGADYRIDEVVKALRQWYEHERNILETKVYKTAEAAAKGSGAAYFNIDLALSRLTTYVLWRDKNEVAFPIFFPYEINNKENKIINKRQEVLSVIIKQFPLPEPNLPLEDIVDFKQDPDTKEKYARLWNWIRNISNENKSTFEVEEEIDWLMTDYTSHLKRLSKQTKNNQLKIVLNSAGDFISNLITFKWGKAASSIFELRGEKIKANDAELKLPGNEIAYLIEAKNILTRKNEKNS